MKFLLGILFKKNRERQRILLFQGKLADEQEDNEGTLKESGYMELWSLRMKLYSLQNSSKLDQDDHVVLMKS